MKEKAIIIDLDGTLVDNLPRLKKTIDQALDVTDPQLWDDFFSKTLRYDAPNAWCMDIVNTYAANGIKVLFVTGRQESVGTAESTREWLNEYVSSTVNYELIMRAKNDDRSNEEVKLDILRDRILPRYDIVFAIDDSKANIDMFRNNGIKSLHCADW